MDIHFRSEILICEAYGADVRSHITHLNFGRVACPAAYEIEVCVATMDSRSVAIDEPQQPDLTPQTGAGLMLVLGQVVRSICNGVFRV